MAIHLTVGLLDAVLDLAADADPEELTIELEATPAGEFTEGPIDDLAPETPVFTHLYPPDVGRSVSAVFGVSLGTPIGRTHGRFVSHPDGTLDVAITDDLHGTVLVAVPPWEHGDVAAFDRHGRRRDVTVVDAEPDLESVPS